MDDEEAEMREHEMVMLREAAVNEARAAQERADAMGIGGTPDAGPQPSQAQRMMLPGDAAMDQEELNPAEEHNLDDDIPDADEMGEEDDESEGDFEDVDDETEEHEIIAARDLDDDVPEAGEYEHTDTEIESSELEDPRAGLSSMIRPQGITRSLNNHQSPLFSGRLSSGSLGLDSSMLLSSPTASRGQQQQQHHHLRRQV